MTLYQEIAFMILVYLWGSVPFGYLLTKYFAGKNILKLGSGNIGSTNVRRIAGKKISILTQLLDMLKGFFPIALFLFFDLDTTVPYYIFLLALGVIIGHDFSLFLKFKGGKGVNTTLGASVLLIPYSVIISVAIYFVVKRRFKYVSLGSIALAIAMPISELIIHQTTPAFYFLFASSILIILLHRQNITRLIGGNELKS